MNSIAKSWIVFAVLLSATMLELRATPITFDLRDTSAATEIESGTITRGGVTATMIPLVDKSSGTLNQNGSGFGINASGSGDESNQLDGDEGIESISISFNADVTLSQIALSSFTSTETGILKTGGFTAISLSGTTDVYDFTSDNFLKSGESIALSFGTGNGFSFDSFTVDAASPSTVPDSLPFGFTAAVLIGVTLLTRRIGQSKYSAR